MTHPANPAALIHRAGVVPVLIIDDAAEAPTLGRILLEGGIPVAEVAFRTPAASESIRRMRGECEGLLVGAGTILTPAQAKEAAAAGATFAMAPGFNPRVADACAEAGLEFFPGVCTPSEIEAAMEKGLSILKFFPAEAMGGLKNLLAISAPYRGLRFIPTGGMTAVDVERYLANPKILACGGTWIAREEWIAARQYDEVSASVREAAHAVANARKGKHGSGD